jgi:hypothetical protein
MCRALLQLDDSRLSVSRAKRNLLRSGSKYVLGAPRLLLVRRHTTAISDVRLRPEDETVHDHPLRLNPGHICKRERVRICV